MHHHTEPKVGLTHIACIMDGNRRWGEIKGVDVLQGYAAGETGVLAAIDGALSMQVPWLTLFAFSTENWERPREEVEFVHELNGELVRRHRNYFDQNQVRIRYIGDVADQRIPAPVRLAMRAIEAATESHRRLTLTLAFNYGGRQDILRGVANYLKSGRSIDELNDESFRQSMQWPDMPDVDLLIRTSGEYRLSNFLLWQLAYSEIVFTDKLWPDFQQTDLVAAVEEYSRRSRRFGGRP